jgi:hypothetical protein
MAPVYSDRDDQDQAELGFGPGGRSAVSGARSIDEEVEEPAAPPARRAPGGEPARADFFRERRRPVLPFLGLIGAVATVGAFLWLGGDEGPPAVAPEAGALAPVAAPSPATPLPDAAGVPVGAPAPTSLAASPPPAATAGEAFPDAGFGDPAPEAPAPAGVAAATPPSAAPTAPPAAALPAVSAPSRTTAAPAARAASGANAFSVQLLAARSEADVNGAWKRLQGTHPDLLASLTPTIARADVAGGPFYRLRAGPLDGRPDAEALCRALSSRQQPCFVVSPGS